MINGYVSLSLSLSTLKMFAALYVFSPQLSPFLLSLSLFLSLCRRRCNNLFFFFCRFSSFSSKSLKSGFARNLFRVDGVDELPVVSSREEKF